MIAKRFFAIILVMGVMLLDASTHPSKAGLEKPAESNAISGLSMYRMSDEIQLSPDGNADRYLPNIAYNYDHHESLVVWHNKWSGSRDVYARRVSDSGEILSWFCVTTGTADRLQPAVAYNATDDEYLVVWMQEASSNVYDIWGRFVAWNGAYMKPEFQIITWADRSFWSPRVAWNSYRNEYMVVWNAFDTTSSFPPGIPVDITGYRVSSSGDVIPAGTLFTTYANPHQVDMVYNVAMDEYFLVFVVMNSQATTGNDIYGLRVSWDGYPVDPPGLIHIYDLEKDQNAPAVATNEQDRYMVVWEHAYTSTDHDIYAREYYVNGDPAGNFFTLSSWTEDTTAPDVASHGLNDEWLAAWQQELSGGSGYAIKGFRWGSNTDITTYYFDIANYVFWENVNPAVSATASGFLITYEGDSSTTYRHIFGRLWWGQSVYLPLILR